MTTQFHNDAIAETGPLKGDFQDLVVEKHGPRGRAVFSKVFHHFKVGEDNGIGGDHLHVVERLLRQGVDVELGEVLAEVGRLERGRVVAGHAGRGAESAVHGCLSLYNCNCLL